MVVQLYPHTPSIDINFMTSATLLKFLLIWNLKLHLKVKLVMLESRFSYPIDTFCVTSNLE